ncbi:UPF0469 protein KIAA0907 [Elysia marginata]|uniref:KH homology domain-containing protein 4 n=1 Tax=Elysia marginata TaxID=1093978 RepID=A0AAV4GYZ7_9GAST|nr:UPF0469 protein KIAA0907 [Elysia marginata]
MIQRVRQGCILSPSLYNLYSEYILQEAISQKSGILINGVNINNIRYADDTVILAESEEQLQAMLDRIVDKCKEYGMDISAKKTKTMHIGRDTKTLTITVGNAVLQQVSKYSYLGHMITEDATLKQNVAYENCVRGKAGWQKKEGNTTNTTCNQLDNGLWFKFASNRPEKSGQSWMAAEDLNSIATLKYHFPMFHQSHDDRSSLEAAAEAAAKVNAILIAKGMLKPNQIHGGPNVITKKAGGPNSLVVAEVEINNLTTPCRNTLTRGTTQEEISKASGAAVTTRGRYIAPDDRVRNPRDRCLYLNVQASTKDSVDIAVQKINEIIRSMCGNKLEPRGRGGNHHRGGRGMRHPYRPPASLNRNNIRNQPPPPLMSLPTPPPPVQIPLHTQPPPLQTVTVLQEKLYVGLEHAPPNFDTKNKLLGPEGSYLHHIQVETGAAVSLRGKGSGFPDMSGADSIEPMHIHIEQQSLEGLQEAKKLAENLIQTVQQSYVSFQQALAALPASVPTGLITGVRQQPPFLEQQIVSAPMAPVPEQQLQTLQPQMQPLGPPQVMLPAASVANQIPQLQAIQGAPPGPPMVIPSSLTLTQMPLVNTLPASAPSLLGPHQPNTIEHQQQQLILSQPPQHGPPPPQLVQQPQALPPAAAGPQPPQPLPPPLQPGGVYTSVQPTLQLVSQPVMSVMQPGQPPQLAGPPPPIAQPQPQPQPIPLQVQSLMGPPPAPQHPYSAATSVVYTVASSTAMPFYSSPKLEEIPKRRFTEDKDDNIAENLLGYQHGPPHLVNLVQSSPPPHSQAAAPPTPAPHVHPQQHHVIQLGPPPPQDQSHPQFQHLPGHPAMIPQPPTGQQQIHLQHQPQGLPAPPHQFHPPPGQQPQHLPPHPQLVPTPHLMVPPPMAGPPHSPTAQQITQHVDTRLQAPPSSSSAMMPPPPPPSPLAVQAAAREEEIRATMPPPKSPEVPWESKSKVSSPSPFESDKKKIRGILKNKSNSSDASKEVGEPATETGNRQKVKEDNGESNKDNFEDKAHPVSPQYQGQPLRYPSMPSDPNLPPTVTQEHQPLPPDGTLLPPGHPSHQLRALHPGPTHGHLMHHADHPPLHLTPHHPHLQIEGPRPDGPAPGTQIVIEHPGLPPPPGMHLAQHPHHRVELSAAHPPQRHVIIEQHPVAQPDHLAPHLAAQPAHTSQELFELEMQQQPPPQFHHIEHIAASQANQTGAEQLLPPQAPAMIVSSGQPFQQYSVAISSAAAVVPPPSYALTNSGVGAIPFSMPNPPQHIVGGPPPPPPPPPASSYSLGGPPPISSYSLGGPPPLPPTSSPQFQPHFATVQLQPQPGHVYHQAQQQPQQQPVPVASSQYQAAPHAQPAISYWLPQSQ